MSLPIQQDSTPDICNSRTGEKWMYSPIVRKHFFQPENLIIDDQEEDLSKFNGEGIVGSPACGDMMKIWVRVDSETDRIKECKWQTFGCASAIASTSAMSVMVTENEGMTIDEAFALKPKDITNYLGGLPDRKIHCSVLGDKALRKAVNNYLRSTEQFDRIKEDPSRIIDPITKVTDQDIQEAVLEGAQDLESVQKKLKVTIGNPEIIEKVENLIQEYIKKYYSE